jgi:5'-nucleotidase
MWMGSSRIVCVAAASVTLAASFSHAQFSLTLLHHSDGESRLTSAGDSATLQQYGGVARFKTVVDNLRAASVNSLTLSNGDMFLAGPQLDAVLSNPAAPFYDGLAQNLIGYDAKALANHEFDFGPGVARRYLNEFSVTPFVGANVSYTAEPTLAPLVGTKLVRSTVRNIGGSQVGIVGIMVPNLASISSPGPGVTVNPDVVSAVQAEVDALTASGINKIVVMGQQQSINNDIAMIPLLRNVDVVISGGGGEIVANPGATLVPGDSRPGSLGGLTNQYPLPINDADGRTVQLVGTSGFYKYVGKLDLTFNAAGEVTAASGDPIRVASLTADPVNGVAADPTIQSQVVAPVQAHIAGLAAAPVGRSTVDLEGRRNGPSGTGIRRTETNLGNLVADSIAWEAQRQAYDLNELGAFSNPIIGLQNGGGIRNDSLIPAASGPDENLSRLTTFQVNAFANFVTVIPDITPTLLKEVLEHSVSNIANNDGRFAQVSGIKYTFDATLPVGSRVLDVTLDFGGDSQLVLIDDGVIQAGAISVNLATIDFLANGGDSYTMLTGLPRIILPATYQQALENYIEGSLNAGGLGRLVTDAQYPMGGGPRPLVNFIPEPATLSLLVASAALMLRRR